VGPGRKDATSRFAKAPCDAPMRLVVLGRAH
jgi:hypothetical protein